MKLNKELILAIVFLLAIFILWIVASNEVKLPSLPPWEDIRTDRYDDR